jgi:hypothetical protein
MINEGRYVFCGGRYDIEIESVYFFDSQDSFISRSRPVVESVTVNRGGGHCGLIVYVIFNHVHYFGGFGPEIGLLFLSFFIHGMLYIL